MTRNLYYERIVGTPQLPRHQRVHPTPHYDCVICVPEHGNHLDEAGRIRAHFLRYGEHDCQGGAPGDRYDL
jgi:hypothetical protein